jgi:poly(3-hydroxybutyrate) depolymerase
MRTASLLLLVLAGCDTSAPTDTGPGTDAPGRDAPGADTPAADAPAIDAPSVPTGSAGCGMASPPTGELTLSAGGDSMLYIVSIPAAYDPARPYPLGFGLHGHGRTHANCQAGDCAGFQDAMQDAAILVYPKSVSAGWQDDSAVRDRNMALFSALIDRTLASYCVDVDRVFVAGTSSGATFSNDVGCHLGDRVRAVIPVAGGVPRREGCVGTPAALVIHGVDDPHVLFRYGEEARDAYRMHNGCSAEVTTPIADLHARVVATRESHECTDYLGCPASFPVRWCEHSEGGYDGSTHGWPLFGGDEIWAFVSALP